MTISLPPTVSVIIPAYNSEQFVGASIDSVLAQSYRPLEVVVVDDGSKDGTKAAVRAFGDRVRYLFQANQGPAAARNTGIAAATGDLICFLDADDLWTADKLESQVAFMEQHPAVGLLFADSEEFEAETVACRSLLATSRYWAELQAQPIVREAFQKLLEENFIPTSTVMIRKECFATAGTFDVMLKGPEDRDMWSRIAAHVPIAVMPRVLARKRVVLSSVSRDVETTLRSRVRLWTKARRLFPELAAAPTVDALLAATYLHLGFVLLHKENTREARQAGLKVFRVSRRPYDWLMGGAIVALSLTGKGFADVVFHAARRVRGKR